MASDSSSREDPESPSIADAEKEIEKNDELGHNSGAQLQGVQTLVFDGPQDVDDPRNWSRTKKIYHTTIPAVHGFTVTMASSIWSPGIADVMKRFHVGRTAAILGLSLYVLGQAFGPVLAAPLSEKRGRVPVYYLSLIIFGLFTVGAGVARNFQTLLICRFLAGFFGAPALSIGAGTNADVWYPSHLGVSTTLFALAPFLGPSIGPVIGGFAVESKGWRWTQWIILFFTAVTLLYSLPMEETYGKIVLRRRAKKRNQPIPQHDEPTGFAAFKFLITVTLLRPIYMLFTEPIVTFFGIYVAFNFAVIYSFYAVFYYVFESVYGFTTAHTGLVFLGISIGYLLGAATSIIVDRVLWQPLYRRDGTVVPEHRLYTAMIGCVGLPLGLFWFGWSARPTVHWISPVLASIPFAWGNLCVFTSSALYMVDAYGPLSGSSALAANGFLRYTGAAAFPLFSIQMFQRLGIGWAASLLGFITVALMPVPFVLFKYGPQIRARSKYQPKPRPQ